MDFEGTKEGKPMRLEKEVGILGGTAIIVGTMIGSGIFITPIGVIKAADSVGLSLLVWLLGGVISMLGALSYAELGTMIPKSGGEHAYLMEAFASPARVPAYLFAWTLLMVLKTSAMAVIAMTFSKYIVAAMLPNSEFPDYGRKIVAYIIMFLIGYINCYSVKLATKLQTFLTASKILALLIIITGGVYKAAVGNTQYLQTGFQNSDWNPTSIALAFYSSLWAYDGWNNLNYLTEEVKNPSKNIPLAIMIGMPLVTFLYVVTNAAYFTVMSPAQIINSPAVALEWANIVLGRYFSWVIPLFVALSCAGALNGYFIGISRVCYVAARDHHLIRLLSFVNIKKLTPIPSVIFIGILASLMIIPGNIEALIGFFGFASWLFYGLTMVALLYLRYTQPNTPRPYKVWIGIPILVLIISVCLVIFPLIKEPAIEFLYATVFILAGMVFYVPFVYYKVHLRCMEKFTLFFQKLLEVMPEESEDETSEEIPLSEYKK
ncbi:unnamed protein product [Gordionus sp. m RMFG-2023]